MSNYSSTLESCAERRGTPAGYKRHRVRGETACTECLAAQSKRSRDQRAARSRLQQIEDDYRNNSTRRKKLKERIALEGKKPPNINTCAERIRSSAGYQRHLWNAEEPCDDCKSAQNEYQKQYRLKNKKFKI